MGVDLTIMPVDYVSDGFITSYNAMSFKRDRRLFSMIDESEVEVPCVVPVKCHFARNDDGDYKFGVVVQNPYGGALTQCSAYQLSAILGRSPLSMNDWICAAVEAMSPDRLIVFYWH